MTSFSRGIHKLTDFDGSPKQIWSAPRPTQAALKSDGKLVGYIGGGLPQHASCAALVEVIKPRVALQVKSKVGPGKLGLP